jgi:hypothetical protein
MLSRFALVCSIAAALLQAPIAAPTARCCSDPDSHQASYSDGCCAAMACCVISDGTAEKAITAAPAANELSAFPAPVYLVSLIDFSANSNEVCFTKAQPVAHSPPPLALLCTFLI